MSNVTVEITPPAEAIDDPLWTPEEAAEFMKLACATLSIWRCTKRYNLAYIKVGRLVRYRKSDCVAFLKSRTITD